MRKVRKTKDYDECHSACTKIHIRQSTKVYLAPDSISLVITKDKPDDIDVSIFVSKLILL